MVLQAMVSNVTSLFIGRTRYTFPCILKTYGIELSVAFVCRNTSPVFLFLSYLVIFIRKKCEHFFTICFLLGIFSNERGVPLAMDFWLGEEQD